MNDEQATQLREDMLTRFVSWLRYERNYSAYTVNYYTKDVRAYYEYVCGTRDALFVPSEGDKDHVRAWISDLMDSGLKSGSVLRKLSVAKSFYRYLFREGVITANPTRGIKGPKQEKVLPAYLTEKESSALIEAPINEEDFEEVRDRLIVETFYETGMRRSELAGLQTMDVRLDEHVIRVLGKGDKERIIPFGSRLAEKMKQYLALRNKEVGNCQFFFVTLESQPMGVARVYKVVHKLLEQIPGLARKGPHVLRHSFATDMLNEGAELTAVKELLGHSSLSTTVRYTHTTFKELQQMYHAHPRAQTEDKKMEVRIQFVHLDADKALEAFIQKKLDRLDRFFDEVIHAEVVLKEVKSNEGKDKFASIRLGIPGNDLFAEKTAASFEEAVDTSIDALKRQIERAKDSRK